MDADASAQFETGDPDKPSVFEYEPETTVDPILETVTEAVVGDAATNNDALGMRGYVDAVARFLTASETLPPLTMSIEGEWGSGKSSFMLQLEDAVRKRSKQKVHIVRFNAWRYEKHEALWAAFALNFVRTLRPNLTRWERLRASFSLLRSRLDFEEGALRIWRTAGLLALLAAAFIVSLLCAAFPASEYARPAWIVGAIAVLGAIAAAGRHAWKTIGSPFESDLKKYFDSPDYRGNRAFVEMFHDDFARIVKAYVKPGERVFVFIDDLDRCEIGRASDLLQALNLLMSGEGLPIIYVLGIDREVVSAGVAAKWEKQVAYLLPDITDAAAKARATMNFALEYLEKFVQVPFRVPTPTRSAIRRYVASIANAAEESNAPAPDYSSTEDAETIWLEVGADSRALRRLCEKAAPLLDNNPRRIKQFLNVLRLYVVLAHERGLFRARGDVSELSLEQLARFIAIVLRYPALVADMRDDGELLSNLESFALGDLEVDELDDLAKSYIENRKLMAFLADDSGGLLGKANFKALLSTVPELSDRWTSSLSGRSLDSIVHENESAEDDLEDFPRPRRRKRTRPA